MYSTKKMGIRWLWLCVLFLFLFLFVSPVYGETKEFSDAPSNIEVNSAIYYLVNEGIVSGSSDGLFHPNNLITYAEFSKILYNAFNLLWYSGDAWYDQSFELLKEYNLIDDSVNPLDNVTYEEGLRLVLMFCTDIPGVVNCNKSELLQEVVTTGSEDDTNEAIKTYAEIAKENNIEIRKENSDYLTRLDVCNLVVKGLMKNNDYKMKLCYSVYENCVVNEVTNPFSNMSIPVAAPEVLKKVHSVILKDVIECGWKIRFVDSVGVYFEQYPTALGMYSGKDKTIYVRGRNFTNTNTTLVHELGHYLYYGIQLKDKDINKKTTKIGIIYESEKSVVSNIIRAYSSKNVKEFFADLYMAYITGRFEKSINDVDEISDSFEMIVDINMNMLLYCNELNDLKSYTVEYASV